MPLAYRGYDRRRLRRSGFRLLDADTFTRADNAASAGNTETRGIPWVAGRGTWGVTGGRLYTATSGGADYNFVVADEGVADIVFRVTIVVAPSPGTCVVARYSTAGNNFVFEWSGGTTYTLYRQQGAVFTSLGASTGAALAVGDTLELRVKGSAWTASLNGVVKVTATDTFNSSATKHGVGNFNDILVRYDTVKIFTS